MRGASAQAFSVLLRHSGSRSLCICKMGIIQPSSLLPLLLCPCQEEINATIQAPSYWAWTGSPQLYAHVTFKQQSEVSWCPFTIK